jgi:hypothetical protein
LIRGISFAELIHGQIARSAGIVCDYAEHDGWSYGGYMRLLLVHGTARQTTMCCSPIPRAVFASAWACISRGTLCKSAMAMLSSPFGPPGARELKKTRWRG